MDKTLRLVVAHAVWAPRRKVPHVRLRRQSRVTQRCELLLLSRGGGDVRCELAPRADAEPVERRLQMVPMVRSERPSIAAASRFERPASPSAAISRSRGVSGASGSADRADATMRATSRAYPQRGRCAGRDYRVPRARARAPAAATSPGRRRRQQLRSHAVRPRRAVGGARRRSRRTGRAPRHASDREAEHRAAGALAANPHRARIVRSRAQEQRPCVVADSRQRARKHLRRSRRIAAGECQLGVRASHVCDLRDVTRIERRIHVRGCAKRDQCVVARGKPDRDPVAGRPDVEPPRLIRGRERVLQRLPRPGHIAEDIPHASEREQRVWHVPAQPELVRRRDRGLKRRYGNVGPTRHERVQRAIVLRAHQELDVPDALRERDRFLVIGEETRDIPFVCAHDRSRAVKANHRVGRAARAHRVGGIERAVCLSSAAGESVDMRQPDVHVEQLRRRAERIRLRERALRGRKRSSGIALELCAPRPVHLHPRDPERVAERLIRAQRRIDRLRSARRRGVEQRGRRELFVQPRNRDELRPHRP